MRKINFNNNYFQYMQGCRNFQPQQFSFNYSSSIWQNKFAFMNQPSFCCNNQNFNNGVNNPNFLFETMYNFTSMIKAMFFKPAAKQPQSSTTHNPTQSLQITQIATTANVDKIKSIPETKTETPDGVQVSAYLKYNVEKAQSYLLQQLPNLSDEDLKKLNISPEKRDRIMEYLKNITYDTDHDTMQAKGAGIVVSTKCSDSDNLANMVTMLMHEANHCDEKYLSQYPEDSETGDLRHRDSSGNPVKVKASFVNTKEEERACETLGLLTTALLIKNGKLTGHDDYGRYGTDGNGVKGHNRVTDYLTNPTLLEHDVNGWVSGYTNYPEGLNNASLTVEHLRGGDDEVKVNLPPNIMKQKVDLIAGDKVIIDGTEYTLGNGENGIVLSPMDSIPVFQIVPRGDTGNPCLGSIIFDGVPLTKEEQEFFNHQHGNQECFGFLNGESQAITFIRKDGKKIKGTLYK